MNFLNNLAVKLGITKSEMTAVTLLSFFLLLGGTMKYSGAMQDTDKAIKQAEAASFSEADVDSLLALALQEKRSGGISDARLVSENLPITTENERPEQTDAIASTKPASKKKLTGTIAFNTASSAQLQRISGIGPVMAKRLVEFRQRKGGKVEHFNDFLEVKGIGKKKLERLKQHLTLD